MHSTIHDLQGRRLTAIAVMFALAMALLAALLLSASGASAARDALPTSDGDNALPAAGTETAQTATVSLAAGGNLIGWTGLDTTTAEIIAGNASIDAIWVFTDGWQGDSAALPAALRPTIVITSGMGMFIITSAATDLLVPTGSSFATNLFPFGDPAGANLGDVTFERNASGVSIWASSTGLTPGNAYTAWFVVWNDPTLCAVACDAPDLVIPGNSVFFGAGGVASAAGGWSFHAHATADGSIDGAAVIPGGLTNPIGATVHLVIRDHGPALTGDALIAQTTQFETTVGEGEVAGDGLAVDVQAAIDDGSNTSISTLEVFQSAPEVDAENIGDAVDGESTVTRTTSGLQITIVDRDLVAGDAYSVWVLIDQPNVANPDDGPFDLAMNLTGGVADADGTATFTGTVAANQAFEADDGTGPIVFVPGTLVDPIGANVRLVIKVHGPASEDPDTLLIQTQRFDGPECPCTDPHQSFHNP